MNKKDPLVIEPGGTIKGELRPPGDKSISHRALILGGLARGTTRIEGFLNSGDCLSTRDCMIGLGVEIVFCDDGSVHVNGRDKALREPEQVLDAGNSGTTARILLGVLAGLPGFSVLTGDQSLRQRPMLRVVSPLRQMGAVIEGRQGGEHLPLAVKGTALKPISYRLPVASAQLKSALLLAGLFASGWTEIYEPGPGRDHTERMLAYMGAKVETAPGKVAVQGGGSLTGENLRVPADFSSAAFFIVAALLLPGSLLTLRDVGINPSRTGLLDVLWEMGANIKITNERVWNGEPVADLEVRGGKTLGPVSVAGDLIPRLVDEVPVLAVAAAVAEGKTEIRDAAELKVKESNRLAATARELTKMGVDIEELPDGLVIKGGRTLLGAELTSYGDHRIAMALAIAALAAESPSRLSGYEDVAISYPRFFTDLLGLRV